MNFLKYIYLLIVINITLCQDTIIVYTIPSKFKINAFEKDLFKEIIKLHNYKTEKHYSVRFVDLNDYSDLFTEISKSDKNDLVCAVRSITITDERKKKYEFSHPYLPIKQVLITKKNSTLNKRTWRNKKHTIAAIENTVHYKAAILLSEKYGFKFRATKEILTTYDELLQGKYDFFIGDISECWNNNYVIFLDDFENAELSNFGIMYPKNSQLRKELDPFLSYFLKSPRIYSLLKKHLGDGVVKYFKEIRNKN